MTAVLGDQFIEPHQHQHPYQEIDKTHMAIDDESDENEEDDFNNYSVDNLCRQAHKFK